MWKSYELVSLYHDHDRKYKHWSDCQAIQVKFGLSFVIYKCKKNEKKNVISYIYNYCKGPFIGT